MAGRAKKKGKGSTVLLIVLIIAAIGCAGWLAHHFYGQYETDSMYKKIADEEPEKVVKKYDNMIGWLTIKGIGVDYPVVRAPRSNPNYYLQHDINGDFSANGCLFIDPNSDLVESYHTIIYGHHMSSGAMFGKLDKYKDQDFADKHPKATFTKWFKDDTYDKGTYKLYAAYPCSIKDKWSYLDFVNITDETKFDDYVKQSKKKSVIKTNVTPKYGDDIITLSTCSYHVWRHGILSSEGRFVVVFVKDNHSEE